MSTTKLNYARTETVAPMRNMEQKVITTKTLKEQALALNTAGANGLALSKGDKFNILGFVPVEYKSLQDVKGTSITKGKAFQAIEMDLQLKHTRGVDTDQFKNTSIRKFLEEWPTAERIANMTFTSEEQKAELENFLSRNSGYTGPKYIANIGAYGFIEDMQKLAWGEDGSADNIVEVADTVRFSYTVPKQNVVEGEDSVFTFNISLYTFSA